MKINSGNTTFIFIYTNIDSVEYRFLTDIFISLKQLQNLGFNNNIHLLIDGYDNDTIINGCNKYQVKPTSIKPFLNNYKNEISAIQTENLCVIVTGHGNSFSQMISSKDTHNLLAENFYEPIEANEKIKNSIFVWGQCFSGPVYKDLTESTKHFYLFGASDKETSKSSAIILYKAIKEKMDKTYMDYYNQDTIKESFLINLFIFYFFIYFANIVNKEINDTDFCKLYYDIKESYIVDSSMIKEEDFERKFNIVNNIHSCDKDDLIEQYSLITNNGYGLEDVSNLPWLKTIYKNDVKLYQDNDSINYGHLALQFEIIYSFFRNIIKNKKNKTIIVTPNDLLKKLRKGKEITESDNQLCFITLFLLSGNKVKQYNSEIENTEFIFNLPITIIENFGAIVADQIKQINKMIL